MIVVGCLQPKTMTVVQFSHHGCGSTCPLLGMSALSVVPSGFIIKEETHGDKRW